MNSDIEIKKVIDQVMDAPIIQSVIGDDHYKNTMGLFISSHGYNNIGIGWRFKNRTAKVSLSRFLSEKEMQDEYALFRNLKLSEKEEIFLRSIPGFGDKIGIDDYINILKNQPMPEVHINLSNDQPDISWNDSNHWIASSRLEIPTLQITLGLYYRKLLADMNTEERKKIFSDGLKRLYADIALLKANPETKIINFANRRVLLPWLHLVSRILVEEIPNQLVGISNVQVAMENGVSASGTIAHEPHMVFAALGFNGTEASIRDSQIKLLTEWVDYYGTGIILPDTFGTHNMIKWLPKELVARFKGARIDSKDPMIAIPEILNWFTACECAPFTKSAVPSDGISIEDAVKFQKQFGKQGLIINAPGTILGSNLDLPKLSIVAKVDTANGIPCVKLSDNIEKAVGDPLTVSAYKKALGYHETYSHKQLV
jgi:nicotinate phosphoribosyltransferase